MAWYELAARNPALFQQLGGDVHSLPSLAKLYAMLRNADQFGF